MHNTILVLVFLAENLGLGARLPPRLISFKTDRAAHARPLPSNLPAESQHLLKERDSGRDCVGEDSLNVARAVTRLLLSFHPAASFTNVLRPPFTQLPGKTSALGQQQVTNWRDVKKTHMSAVLPDQKAPAAPVKVGADELRLYANFNYLSRYEAVTSVKVGDLAPLVGSITIAGEDPERYKVNQDAHFHARMRLARPNSDSGAKESFSYWTVAGVMDGHGRKGHVVSDFLKDRLPFRIEEQLSLALAGKEEQQGQELKEMEEGLVSVGCASLADFYRAHDGKEAEQEQDKYQIHRALVRAFHLAQLDARKSDKVPTKTSGTTAAVTLLDEERQRVYVAHVGDSLVVQASTALDARAYPERDEDNFQGEDSVIIVNAQSVCTVNFFQEQARIQKTSEGRLDGEQKVCRGHICVPTTRTLGNSAMLVAGVLPTPLIEVADLFDYHSKYQADSPIYGTIGSRSFNFLVLGTDGVFEVMSEDDVVRKAGNVLLRGGGAEEAAEAVAKEARRRWIGDLFDVRVDDITCTVVLLPPPKLKSPSPDAINEAAQQGSGATTLYADAWSQVSRRSENAVKLGEGQHGEVWRAEASDDSGTYAIKLIDIEEPGGREVAEGEERGFRASDDLQRKAIMLAKGCGDDKVLRAKWENAASHLVRYLHLAEDWSHLPSVCYVVMEYVGGQTLQEIGSSLTETQRISVYMKIAEVIDLLSTNEVGSDHAWVHRDIKTENVMVNFNADGSLRIKLIDMGTVIDRKTKQRNFYRGTNWHWVPFEQRTDPDSFAICGDEISAFDMFSLGILIFQMECGEKDARVISNPEEDSSDEARARIDTFLATELGKIATKLTDRDPCKRPRPVDLVEALEPLYRDSELKSLMDFL